MPVGELFQAGRPWTKLQVPLDSPGGDARPVEVELAQGPFLLSSAHRMLENPYLVLNIFNS